MKMLKKSSDKIQIRALIENWAQAVRQEDLAGTLENHTKDIVMFDVPPPLQSKGIVAYEETWRTFFENTSGGKGFFYLRELKMTTDRNVAFCHALLIIAGGQKPTCRLTMGFKKIRGRWFVSHEHHSYPFENSSSVKMKD